MAEFQHQFILIYTTIYFPWYDKKQGKLLDHGIGHIARKEYIFIEENHMTGFGLVDFLLVFFTL